MSVAIDDLDPEVTERARAFVKALTDAGIQHAVTCTRRTIDEQVAYFAQGRAPLEIVNLLRRKAGMRPIGLGENTYKITNCDGVTTRSPHQDGHAMDVVPAVDRQPVWPPPTDKRGKEIATIGKAIGWKWGGEWPDFPDYPHYQI